MIIPYKEQFVQPIKLKIKIHTIREDVRDRWKPGRPIQMATGVRTKHYHCFKRSSCVSTQKIIIETVGKSMDMLRVWVDERELTFSEVVLLAKNDGFADIEQFRMWFLGGFVGKIIHWTTFKY